MMSKSKQPYLMKNTRPIGAVVTFRDHIFENSSVEEFLHLDIYYSKWPYAKRVIHFIRERSSIT